MTCYFECKKIIITTHGFAASVLVQMQAETEPSHSTLPVHAATAKEIKKLVLFYFFIAVKAGFAAWLTLILPAYKIDSYSDSGDA